MSDAVNLIFTQDFLLRALLVGVLISLCSALLGVSLVLKRFSMIGDGLSHVGFGAMAIACAANIAPLYFALPIVICSAFLLLRMSENGKIKGDAAIALISTGALAVGVMATSVTTGMNIDIYNYMFGSILTTTGSDVLFTAVLSSVVIILFVIFYSEIFAVTFDESFAKATGTRTSLYNMLLAVLTAVTIVIGMRMMGALLISSLMIFPTVTSMRVCKSFRSVIVFSSVISVFCFITGLLLSVKYETPTGASVVCVNIFMFAAVYIIKTVNSKSFYGKNTLRRLLTCLSCLFFAAIYLFVMLSGTDSLSERDNRVSVVTTGFAQYDFSRNIVGDKGEVTMLLSPGEESHTYEPTPADITKIKECDVFVYGGGESEKWADSILDTFDGSVRTVRMMDVVDLYEEVHDDEHTGHTHGHEETEYDEHVWTSPLNAAEITREIGKVIIEADGQNADYYRDNTEKYIAELKALDEDYLKAVSQAEKDYIVIGDRFPLRYLTERYGIGYYSAFPGCSAQAEANPVTIAGLIDKINNDNISVVFKVDLGTGKVAGAISESTGAEIRTLYSCHVISGEDFEKGEGYIGLMRKNLENISYAME